MPLRAVNVKPFMEAIAPLYTWCRYVGIAPYSHGPSKSGTGSDLHSNLRDFVVTGLIIIIAITLLSIGHMKRPMPFLEVQKASVVGLKMVLELGVIIQALTFSLLHIINRRKIIRLIERMCQLDGMLLSDIPLSYHKMKIFSGSCILVIVFFLVFSTGCTAVTDIYISGKFYFLARLFALCIISGGIMEHLCAWCFLRSRFGTVNSRLDQLQLKLPLPGGEPTLPDNEIPAEKISSFGPCDALTRELNLLHGSHVQLGEIAVLMDDAFGYQVLLETIMIFGRIVATTYIAINLFREGENAAELWWGATAENVQQYDKHVLPLTAVILLWLAFTMELVVIAVTSQAAQDAAWGATPRAAGLLLRVPLAAAAAHELRLLHTHAAGAPLRFTAAGFVAVNRGLVSAVISSCASWIVVLFNLPSGAPRADFLCNASAYE